ncbi:DNA/RNA non-specific endonuclease [Streptomyces flaveolus]|uniref:DNA/RNA non-specific endonuclease n=1 Tax=Streptomyces flaveolus TaxID=67297 RepID=UPI0033E2C855
MYTDSAYHYTYTTDAQGRPRVAQAVPLLSGSGNRQPCQTTVGGWGGTGYDGGHLIADSFGGVTQRYNLVPMPAKLNRPGGLFYKFEDAARGCLKTSHTTVTLYHVGVTYPSTITVIPSSYRMRMEIRDKHHKFRTIDVTMPEKPTDAQWVKIESEIEATRHLAGCQAG